jgi:uncharacterized repeat protein (TIGR01451 family)
MKINKTLTALIAGASLGLSGQAFAAGTLASTAVSNVATLSYTVNLSAVPSTSSQADFSVDAKVDLSLSSDNTPSADAGATTNLEYTITNTGNSTQFFKLDSDGSDVFKLSVGDTVIVDGVLQLAPDAIVTFYLEQAVSDTAADGSTESYNVNARVSDAAGTYLAESTADKNASQTTLDDTFLVFAEATTDSALPLSGGTTRDGGFTAQGDITVSAPVLTGTKTVVVKDDGLGGTTPFAIPGATVTYTIVINSTGTKDATGVTFTDDLNTNAPDLDFTTISNIVVLDNADAALTVTTDYTVTNDGTAAGIISLGLPDITTGEKLTVSFDIDIK